EDAIGLVAARYPIGAIGADDCHLAPEALVLARARQPHLTERNHLATGPGLRRRRADDDDACAARVACGALGAGRLLRERDDADTTARVVVRALRAARRGRRAELGRGAVVADTRLADHEPDVVG